MMTQTTASDAATVMDRMYRWQRHVYDLTRKYYLLGRDRLIARLDARAGTCVLEIGCGTARNLIAAARRYPQARFYGVDVSNEMLQSARRHIVRYGYGHHVMVAQGDATDFDPGALFGRPLFERVFISYSLSMIPHWRAALDHALSLVAPGGELHIVDFGTQERLPRWARAMLRRWLALFGVVPRDDLAAALRADAARCGVSVSIEHPCLGYAQYAVVRVPPATGLVLARSTAA